MDNEVVDKKYTTKLRKVMQGHDTYMTYLLELEEKIKDLKEEAIFCTKRFSNPEIEEFAKSVGTFYDQLEKRLKEFLSYFVFFNEWKESRLYTDAFGAGIEVFWVENYERLKEVYTEEEVREIYCDVYCFIRCYFDSQSAFSSVHYKMMKQSTCLGVTSLNPQLVEAYSRVNHIFDNSPAHESFNFYFDKFLTYQFQERYATTLCSDEELKNVIDKIKEYSVVKPTQENLEQDDNINHSYKQLIARLQKNTVKVVQQLSEQYMQLLNDTMVELEKRKLAIIMNSI